MKIKLFINLFVLLMIVMSTNIVAKSEEWKTKKTKDGKITAKYNVSKLNNSGFQLVEYMATTIDSLNMQSCISLLKDVSKHKDFQDDQVSKKIKTISENEWLLYYYSKGMGPFPDLDCVTKMTFIEDTTENLIEFKFTAAPEMYEKKEAKRMTVYDVVYSLKDLGNGMVKLSTSVKMSPMMKVPTWMMNAAFPGAAFEIIEKFIELSKEI